VDLLTGRFTTHDWARWGRLWWSRLAQLAARHGERRTELETLLSDGLPIWRDRRHASRRRPCRRRSSGSPRRDFRIVHFGGHALVRVPVPPELDLHLTARVVRDRYGRRCRWPGSRAATASCSVATTRPAGACFDLGAMVEHLAEKFGWVEALPDPDHVARFRVADVAAHPERVDEVVAEIAMGRSLLEG
jgi:hypothetical protein